MANDKKFIVKNGLLTPENAVIGSNTDTGEKLQVTGDTVLSQSTAGTPTLKVTNTGGNNAVIGQFQGDSSSLQVKNLATGDYQLVNTGQNNGIIFYNDTGGVSIQYNGGDRLVISNSGNEFSGLSNTTIDGNRILTVADEGPGNGLDADTVDGLQAAQFVRADVDDIMAGNYTIQNDLTIQGDLTVSGNTTTVNTEEILLADNIITINSNYTGSSPTEDGGIEVERGSLSNAKVIWNEASDYWQLEVNGAVLGRIITTADEGSGNGFDADTVDGLEAAQFLRSDADDTATGNITIEGDITVGDNSGPAQIFFDGQNNNRTLYSNNGEIGFLNNAANFALKSDADGDLEVERDVEAGRDVTADRNIVAADNITATTGNISATAGDVTAGDDVIAQNNVTATTGNVAATAGNVTAGQDVTAGDDMIAQNNITSTAGNITASAGNVSATVGDVTAGDDVIAQNNVTATTGNVSATTGNVTAGDSVTAQNDITATTGNISASAGSVSAATTVTAGTDVIGQRFVDADNNSYFANPASNSIFSGLGLDDNLFHNGDTDTRLRFETDDISLQTGGAERLGVDNTGVQITGDLNVDGDITANNGVFTGDLSASRFTDADDNSYFADPNATSVMNRIGIDDYIQHNGDTDTYFGFNANDNYQIFTGGAQRLEVNGTYLTSAVDGIFPNLYAGRYYDSNNATYYGDFASTSRVNDISLVGEIISDGDTNTYLQFHAADQFRVVTGGVERFEVNNTFVLASNQMRSPIYYDNNDTAYYGNFAGDSQMQEVHIDDWIRHRGDTNTYLGFPAADTIELTTGGGIRATINNSNATFFSDVLANRFVDRNSTGYYLDPANGTLSATFASGIRIDQISNYTRYDDTSGNGGIALAGHGDIAGGQNTTIAVSGNYSGAYSLMYLNRIDPGANPFNNGNRFISFGADGANYSTIRGDSSGNLYLIPASSRNIGFWTSGGNEVAIALDDGNFVVGGSSVSYTSMDNTPLVGSITNNKLHVNGSIQLTSDNDAIVFGRGTSTFLKDEELGFGWGGGWYMLEGTYIRARNNKHIYTQGAYYGNVFYSYQNSAYYVDPDGDSQLNTVDIDDYVRHRGDTNTYMGFNAADQIQFVTNASNRLQITNSTVRARNKFEVYGSGIELQKQSNGNGVGITMTDQNSGENPGLSGLQQASIKVFHSDNAVTSGAELAMLFDSSENNVHYVFAQQNGAGSGSLVPRQNNAGNLGLSSLRWANLYVTTGNFTNLYASRYYDADDNSFYGDFNSRSEMNSVNLRHNSAVVSGNGNFNTASSVLGGLHFRNGAGVNGSPRMAAITFQGSSTSQAQAGIYVSNDNSSGTHMAFAVTDSYAAGPQLTARFRNDGLFQTYRAYALFAGSARAPLFYDSNNTAFYVDPLSTSQMNRIDIEDYIRHRNDTNTFFGFQSNDTFRVWTNGTQRLNIDNNSMDSSVFFYAPRFIDSNSTSRYIEPGGGGLLQGNFEFAASSTSRGYSTAAIELRESNYTGNGTATPPVLGFHWGGIVASTISMASDGTIEVRNNPGTGFEKFRALQVSANIYYDANNTARYMDPASRSQINAMTINDGNDLQFETSGNNIRGYIQATDTNDSHFIIATSGGEDIAFKDGGLSGTTNFLIRGDGDTFTTRNTYAQIFYDSQNSGYYVDPASNSRFNTAQALRYYLHHGTTYYLDQVTNGQYGSVQTGGNLNGWAGYSINGQWVLMSNGPDRVGIYNDTDNEWGQQWYRNSYTLLYFNGIQQAQTASGYFLANNQMRAPIYYDSNNTAYFGNFADRSRMRTLEVGTNSLTGSGSYALGVSHNNRYAIGFRNTNINGNYPWLVHDNYNFNQKGNRDAFIVHFNGLGDRLRLTETGDMLIDGEMAASNYNLSGGNENISLSKLYTRGAADETLFDGTMYFEKRVIKVMQGAENNTTADTNEFVKSTDAPGSSSYVLRTSAYRTFYSDYVEVEPGEEVFGEIHVKTISGSGGRLYYGIERFDKDKRPIAGNTGTTYFVVGGSIPTSTSWQTYRNHTTIPTSHTPYNGSDGGGVRYVRLRILYNYNAGGALREFTMPILKRTNYHSHLKTEYDVHANRFYSTQNTSFYVDPDNTSLINDLTADRIDMNIIYDRGNTGYYLDPDSTSQIRRLKVNTTGSSSALRALTIKDQSTGELNFGSYPSSWTSALQIQNNNNTDFIWISPLADGYNARFRTAGSGLDFYTDGANNTGTHSLFVGSGYAQGIASLRAPIFYDSNDTNYYVNPNSDSVLHNVNVRNYGLRLQRNYTYNGIWFNGGTDQNHVLWNHYYGGPAGRGGAGSGGFDGMLWNTYAGLRIRGGSAGAYNIARFSTGGGGNTNSHYVQLYANNVEQLGTRGGYGFAPNQFRTPLIYDTNNTGYYLDPHSTTRINQMETLGRVVIGGTFSNNAYSSTNSTRLHFGGGNSDANGNYYIGTNKENYNGNYNKLDLRWHTGIRMGAQAVYGGTRIYNNEDLSTLLFSVGRSDTHTRVESSNLYVMNGDARAQIFYDIQDTNYYANPNGTSRFLEQRLVHRLHIGDETNLYNGILQGSALNRPDLVIKGQYPQLNLMSTRINNSTHGPTLRFAAYDTANASSGNFKHWVIGIAGTNATQLHFGYTPNQTNPHYGIGRGWSSGNNVSMMWLQNNRQVYMENNLYANQFVSRTNTGYYIDPDGNSRFNTVLANRVYPCYDNNTGIYIDYPTGNYGSIQVNGGGRGSWEGYSINGRYVFMSASNSQCGIYNDVDNEWMWYGERNGATYFYYNGTYEARTQSGYFRMERSGRAPIFYDLNDTGYYMDPNSTSNSSIRQRGGTLHGPNTTWGDYLAVGTNGHWSGSYASVATTNGNLHLDSRSGRDLYLQWYVGRTVFVSGAIQATIYYDRNNTSYYADMASTSYFNDFRANIVYDRTNTAYYIHNSSGDASMRTVVMDRLNMRDRGDFITFYGNDSDYHGIASRSNGGGISDDIRINSYHDVFINLDSNNNNSSGSTGLYVGQHGAGTGNISGWYFQAMADGNSYSSSSFRTYTFYAREDTAYYVDPNGTARLRAVYANDWFRADGGSGLYFQDYGYGVRGAQAEGNSYGNISTYGTGRNGWSGYGIDRKWCIMSSGTGNSNNFGVHNNDSSWLWYWNGSYTNTRLGYLNNESSMRAPIFYDSNNTGYYFNGASDNSTRFRGVNNLTMAFMAMPGHTRNSAEYYRARPRITGDTNYWTGAMGWGRVDMNAVATWGSGFIDSWSNPPNQPSGTSHWVGVQAYHYRSSNTAGYGWQMVGGPITNLRFRSSWSGWRSWRTIPILDENSGNGGAMYAGIYYDSNSTGYYMNPASTSNWNTSQQNGYHTFLNYGIGVTGTYTSTRLQLVFAMGSAYRLRSDGNATNNMYGIAWSHPNAGSKGGANQLNDHGMLIINNGGFRAAISSRAVFSSDVRTPIYYDWNNTGYYTDPNGTSRLNQVTANRFNSPYAGGNSGITRASSPYSFGFQESGGWGYPYPDLVLQYHTGMSFAANPSYGGMRFFNDYNSGTVRFQINGGSSYTYANTWLRVAGANQGIYSSHTGAHFEPNARTSYGSWNMQGSRSGYYGISWHQPTWDPHLMFDGNGSGGIYMQGGGRWVYYHNRSNNCTGFASSSTVSGYRVRINGSLYCNGNIVAYSDERDKDNIITIDGALDKVLQLRGVYYDRKTRKHLVDDRDEIYKGRQLGLIAQEVKEIVPEVVSYAEEVDQYGLDYPKMVGLLVEGIKDQNKIVESQQKLINSQQEKIDKLEEMVYNIMNKMENK